MPAPVREPPGPVIPVVFERAVLYNRRSVEREFMNRISCRNRYAIYAVVLVVSFVLAACGKDSSDVDPTSFAAGWRSLETDHAVFFEPPDSPTLPKQAMFADYCENILGQWITLLDLTVPEKIEIFRFVTNQECEEATGHTAGYVDGYRIYTRIGARMGGALALAAFTSVDPEAKSFGMIRHGFREAFDLLTENPHTKTSQLRAEGRWESLPELISTTQITDQEAYDAQTASFVAYLIQRHGATKFKMLWRSVLDLGPSLEKIYGGSLQQLEDDWIVHMEREAKKT